jgi:hypothetical protein
VKIMVSVYAIELAGDWDDSWVATSQRKMPLTDAIEGLDQTWELGVDAPEDCPDIRGLIRNEPQHIICYEAEYDLCGDTVWGFIGIEGDLN